MKYLLLILMMGLTSCTSSPRDFVKSDHMRCLPYNEILSKEQLEEYGIDTLHEEDISCAVTFSNVGVSRDTIAVYVPMFYQDLLSKPIRINIEYCQILTKGGDRFDLQKTCKELGL